MVNFDRFDKYYQMALSYQQQIEEAENRNKELKPEDLAKGFFIILYYKQDI